MLDLGSFAPAPAAPDALHTMPPAQAGQSAGETGIGASFGSFVDALADAADGNAREQADGDDRDDQLGLTVAVDMPLPIAPIALPVASPSATGAATEPALAIGDEQWLDLPLSGPSGANSGTLPEVELPAATEETAIDLPLWPATEESGEAAEPIDQASLARLKRAMAQADAAMTFRAAMRTGASTGAGAQETGTAISSSTQRQAAEIVARAFAQVRSQGDHTTGTPGADRTAPVSALATVSVLTSAAAEAGAPITAPIDRPGEETATQIVQAIKLQWSRGIGEAHIRLEPQSFGGLTVSLKVEDGLVIARLQSDTAVIREWLQNNQAALRQSLADHQLTLDRLEVTEPADDTRHDERRDRPAEEREPGRPPRRARGDGTGETFEIVA